MKKLKALFVLMSLIWSLPLLAQTYAKGDKVEALWHGSWYKSTIEQIMKENLYKVHFTGYWASREEFLGPERLRPIAARTQPDWNILKSGDAVEFLEGDHWHPAIFVERNDKRALIRYADGESQKEERIAINRISVVPPSPATSPAK